MGYELLVNADRTFMVTLWDSGSVELATRAEPVDVWGPPIPLAPADGSQRLPASKSELAGEAESRLRKLYASDGFTPDYYCAIGDAAAAIGDVLGVKITLGDE